MKSFPESGPCRLDLACGSVLKELPISTASVCGKDLIYGGGGYFRLLPWWLIHACFRRSDYNMTYFHPRDFEPNHPQIPGLGLVRQFKSNVGVGKSKQKLRKLLGTFEFCTVTEAVDKISWIDTPLVPIRAVDSPVGW